MSSGMYLFCLLPGEPLPRITGKGIDGEHPLLVETIGDIAAIFAEVDLGDFSGPGSAGKLEDLAWVAPRALRHEEILLSAMAQGPVLPVRFGTVFSSPAAAAESIQRHRNVVLQYWRDTLGRQEWMVKGLVFRSRALAQMIEARLVGERAELAGLPPGRRYFFEQKIKGAVEKELAGWLGEMEQDLLRLAKEVSVDLRPCRLQTREVTGRDEEMFFHGALLVADRSAAGLQERVEAWNRGHDDQGLQIELSGPWPPYHFAPVF